MIRIEKKINLTILFVLLLTCGFSQQKSSYNGPLQVASYSGNAKYQYNLVDKDTIKDGAFQMGRSSLEALLEKDDASFLIKGNFKKGIPNGDWQFQFNDFETDAETKIIDLEYRVLINGTQKQGAGGISGGKVDGDWIYEINRIKDSEVEKVLFKSNFIYDKGIPQQNFKIENENTVLVGRFLRNGFAEDEWASYEIDKINDTESWFYSDGLLRKIVIVKNNEYLEIPVFADAKENTKTVYIDSNYLELIRTTIRSKNPSVELQGGISSLLSENQRSYAKIDTIMSALGATEFTPRLKVKVPFYPLNSNQKRYITEIAEDFKIANAISKSLLNNSHLNIIKRSDADARFNYNAASQITDTYLKPLEKLVHYQDEGLLDYLSVSELVQVLWPNGKPNATIEIVMDSLQTKKTFALPDAANYTFKENDLKSVSLLASYAKQSLQNIAENMSVELKFGENVQNLNTLEEALIAKNDSLVQLIDSALTGLPKKYAKALSDVQFLTDTYLNTYATTTNAAEKLKYGERLKGCLDQHIILSHTFIALPSQVDSVQRLYKDAIWNPFMATVMEEDVKKRIIAAYTKILVPHYLSYVATDLSCENIEEFINSIVYTNERMVALREEETRKLERKLRRKKNPQEIMNLLHQRETAKK